MSSESVSRFLGLMLVAWQPFVSGPRLPSLLLLLLGLWLLARGRLALTSGPARRLGYVFILLGLPVLLSLPASQHLPSSLNVAVALALFYIVGLVLLYGLRRKSGHAWLQRWLLITLAVWIADGYVQFFFGRDLLGVSLSEDGRVLGPFAGNLRFGLFLTVLMPVILWQLATARPWLTLVLIGLLGFIAAMSGARSNLLCFFLASGVLLPRFGWRQRAVVLLAGGLALAAAMTSPSLSARWAITVQTLQAANATAVQRADQILSGRMTIWETAWRMFQDRPLTGVGAGAFARVYDRYSPRGDDPFRSAGSYGSPSHAHQMYIAAAAETGLLGLAGLIGSVALCLRWFVTAPAPQRARAAPYAGALAVIAFPLQSQPVLFTIWWFPVVLLLLCAMLAALGSTPAASGGQPCISKH